MKDIEDTEGLSKEQLHAALANGDARDRVIAIWALALRSAPLSFGNQLRNEPDPGVRRALAVVLASHGEIDLLVAMCRHDPNVFVRASTVQILVRFAVAGRVPWSLVIERLADEPEVRASLFSQLDETAPVELALALDEALRDANDLVRREAFETCARLSRGKDIDVLRDVVSNATEEERTHLLQTWFRVETPTAMCTILASLPAEIRVQAVLMYPALAHSSLRPLRESAAVYRRVEHLLRLDITDVALRVVLELATLDLWRRELVLECTSRLAALATMPIDVREIAVALRDACTAPATMPIEEGDMVAVDDDEYDCEHELENAVTQSEYATLRAELDRLLD